MPKLLTTGSIVLWGFALCWLFVPESAQGGQFEGNATNYGREECITLDHFSQQSGAQYLEKDSDQEARLCGIDFDSNHRVVPKNLEHQSRHDRVRHQRLQVQRTPGDF